MIQPTKRRHHAVTLEQAAHDSPTLSRLAEAVRDSSARLKAVERLIPPSLRSCVQAGPVDGDSWCILVNSNAAAAKLRQVLPALLSALQTRGWEITSIRLKVQIPR